MARAASKSKQAKKKTGRAKKEVLVAGLLQKTSRAKGMVFTNYQGLTHKQLETLKKAVKTMEAEYVITKNTLLKRAIETGGAKIEDASALDQPTATLFTYGDITEPLKVLAKMIKEVSMPVIKFGLLDGKTLTAQEITKLATLPSREVLLTQLVGGLKSPIYGLHRSLNWNLQKLVMTLKAVEQKKS